MNKNFLIITFLFFISHSAYSRTLVTLVGTIDPKNNYGINVQIHELYGLKITVDVAKAEMCDVESVQVELFDGGKSALFVAPIEGVQGVFEFSIATQLANRSRLNLICAQETETKYKSYLLRLEKWL